MRFSLLISLSLVGGLCGWIPARGASGNPPPKIAVFSSILTEVAVSVVGSEASVTGFIPPGTDPHSFQLTPRMLQQLGRADLVILSAKHLESYVNKLQEATKARFLHVGDQMPSLYAPLSDGSLRREEDPHWWHSIRNMQIATQVVCAELCRLDPPAANTYRANAARYIQSLQGLHLWAKQRIAELPKNQRKLVTSHDAFQYFARDYGFTIHAVEGLTPSEQPSSQRVADLLELIRRHKIRAVFSEETWNPKVLREITSETGAIVAGDLVADGLGNAERSTYAGMFRHNVNTIVNALTPSPPPLPKSNPGPSTDPRRLAPSFPR